MNRFYNLAYSSWFWWSLILLIVFISGIFIYANMKLLLNHLSDLLKWLVALIGLFLWLNNKLQPFYLSLAKIRAVMFNVPVSCSINADYKIIGCNENSIAKLKQLLLQTGTKRSILKEHPDEIIVKIDGIDIYVRSQVAENEEIDGPDYNENLNIQILDYHAPYGLILNVLTRKLMPLLEDIEKYFKTDHSSYVFEAIFINKHPFLGLYAQRIPFNSISSFTCEYIKPDTANKRSLITITKRGFSIKTSKLTSLIDLIYTHLAVSGG